LLEEDSVFLEEVSFLDEVLLFFEEEEDEEDLDVELLEEFPLVLLVSEVVDVSAWLEEDVEFVLLFLLLQAAAESDSAATIPRMVTRLKNF